MADRTLVVQNVLAGLVAEHTATIIAQQETIGQLQAHIKELTQKLKSKSPLLQGEGKGEDGSCPSTEQAQ